MVLESCYKVLEGRGKVTDRQAEKQFLDLLVSPLEKFGLLEVLHMAAYPPLMGLLSPATSRELSLTICRTMLKFRSRMSSIEDLDRFLALIDLLIQDQPGDGPIEDDAVRSWCQRA